MCVRFAWEGVPDARRRVGGGIDACIYQHLTKSPSIALVYQTAYAGTSAGVPSPFPMTETREYPYLYSTQFITLRGKLQLELFLKPLCSRVNRLIHRLGLRALTLPRRLLAAGATANDLRHARGPALCGDTLGGKVLLCVSRLPRTVSRVGGKWDKLTVPT